MKTLPLALTAVSAIIFAAGVASANDATETVAVKYTYGTQHPMAQSISAIEKRAKRACIEHFNKNDFGIPVGYMIEECAEKRTARAVATSNNPDLIAFYEAR